ncbi:hypothetical protein ACD661_16385 [Legionella lytica]|uniref:Uncharacterized protein n=1 Tax=Legionella lytica TaxID=96232 RepID=A0ABW8DD67_9GAMM
MKQKVNQAIEGFYGSIVESLSPSLRDKLEYLIIPELKEAYAQLADLRTSPQNASSDMMNQYLDYFEEIEQLGILDCNLAAIHRDVIKELAQKGRYYDAFQLRDMASKVKREAIIICFLHETAKTILVI